jgi:hypothetical protein
VEKFVSHAKKDRKRQKYGIISISLAVKRGEF